MMSIVKATASSIRQLVSKVSGSELDAYKELAKRQGERIRELTLELDAERHRADQLTKELDDAQDRLTVIRRALG